jgi:hypothetical protein
MSLRKRMIPVLSAIRQADGYGADWGRYATVLVVTNNNDRSVTVVVGANCRGNTAWEAQRFEFQGEAGRTNVIRRLLDDAMESEV